MDKEDWESDLDTYAESLDVRQTQTETPIERLHRSVATFLRQQKGYQVYGGRAVLAWLDPTLKAVKPEHRHHFDSRDWDIAVEDPTLEEEYVSMNQQYIHYTSKPHNRRVVSMANALEAALGTRLERTWMVFMLRGKNVDLLQMSVVEPGSAPYPLVEFHAERSLEPSIVLDGIQYCNLKWVVSDLENSMNPMSAMSGKLVKRSIRLEAVKRALKIVQQLNPVLYQAIRSECRRTGNESITGLHLSCADF